MSNDPFAFTAGDQAPKNGAGMQALTPGDYRYRVADLKAGTSKSSGKPMLIVDVDVLSEEGDVIGKAREHIVQGVDWKRDQFASSIGVWPGEGKPYTLYPADVIGLEGTVTIGNETGSNGGTFNSVVAFVIAEF